MITAKEAKKITEDSHPYEEEIPAVRRAFFCNRIEMAAKMGKFNINFGNCGDYKVTAWLISYGYNCWYDNQLNLWVGWNK
jgi:hypothetical protein